jgi:hypothetical protein
MKTAIETPEQAQNNQIINVMVRHLGGKRFFAFTGSKPQYKTINNTSSPAIMLKLARNQSKANYLEIKYNSGLDVYEMEFIKSNAAKPRETIKSFEMVYDDMLQQIFTSVTGLYTTL